MKHTIFSNDISYFRKNKNYSQKELANLIDIERSELSRIENGHYVTSKELLEKIAKVLDCRISQIYTKDIQDIILDKRK